MVLQVKVCGLTEPARVEQACALGAAYVGFILFPPSPRAIAPEVAADLSRHVAAGVQTVGVFVDPTDAWLSQVLSHIPLDVIQLHGGEDPERVRQVGLATGCRVMKALRVESADDLADLDAYAEAADMILFDAKPPRDAAWPGGHGLAFDWRLLQDIRLAKPWALAGGLTAENLAKAVALTGATMVDVSSSIESRPGIKDPAKLASFMNEAARLNGAAERQSA